MPRPLYFGRGAYNSASAAFPALIGHEQGAAIAKEAYAEGRTVIDVAKEGTNLSEKELKPLLDPEALIP